MKVEPLLRDAVGMHQDRGRDDVPPGHVWAMLDMVPRIAGASLRGRGRWTYNSQILATAPRSLVWAPYLNGAKLVTFTDTQAYDVPVSGATALLIGTLNSTPAKSNPHFYRDKLYAPQVGGGVIQSIAWNGATWTLANLPASAPVPGSQISSYRDRLIASRQATLYFAKPGDPTLAWDAISFITTSAVITGLWAMRNQILVFHGDTVEQIRGTTPPDSTLTDPTGDMQLGVLWHGAGCYDARSLAGWQENLIFADERGIHITDGGLVRNMIEQGGLSRLWRSAFERGGGGEVESVGGTVFGNFYVCTVRMSSAGTPSTTTWICEIPTRNMFRWSNIDSRAHAVSTGNIERLFGTNTTTKRAINMENCMRPTGANDQVDDNAVVILPEVETAWLRLSKRAGWRRFYDLMIHFLGYEASDVGANLITISYVDTPEDTTYTVLGTLKRATVTTIRKLPVGGRFQGIALKIAATSGMVDFRLHEIGATVEAEEEHRI